MATSGENVEIVRGTIEAFNRGDVDEALEHYAPDAEWHTTGLFADERVYRGRDGIRGLGAEVEEDMEDVSFSVSEIREVGGRVVVGATTRGRGKRSKARFEQAFWYVITLRDGLIVRVEAYVDPTEAVEAAGLSE